MEQFNTIQMITIYALPVLFAITVHEAAHAYAARHFGDNTAYMMGRMTLNPIKHIDPIGTILLPLVAMVLGGMLFGWAKPVPVNFGNLRQPKKDMRWVALAGPASNLAMAILWGILFKVALSMGPEQYYQQPLQLMATAGLQINVVLMVLNLLPIPPLDGGRILVSILPNHLAYQVSRLEPYGMFILIGLLITNLLSVIMNPFIALTFRLLSVIL